MGYGEVGMSNQEILERAIQKAIDGGFTANGIGQEIGTVADVYYYFDDDHGDLAINNLIWRHDFCRALWGEELHHETFVVPNELSKRFAGTKDLDVKPMWQYHLQQMVIADNPIQYLGENTNTKGHNGTSA